MFNNVRLFSSHFQPDTTHSYAKIKKYLEGGGTDGSYNYNTGPNEAGLNPGDDLRQAGIPWQFIFQGAHTTTKGYVDHINMYVEVCVPGCIRFVGC